ncbi:hypothetical protein ACFLQL_00300 [Verrucomicrobiota bacterium]
MDILFTEYSNQNSQRSYPFNDNATLLTAETISLPLDLFIDAMLYPFNVSEPVYLAEINQVTDRIIIKGVTSDDIYGIGIIDNWSTNTIIVYDSEDYMRQIGTLCIGPGVTALQAGFTYLFEPEATTFCGTVFSPVNQEGVQGFVLDDGSLVYGDVTFQGENGLNILSEKRTGSWTGTRDIITFNAVGAIPINIDEQDCLGIPIKCIKVIVTECSKIMASDYELDPITHESLGIIALTPNGVTLQSLCKDNKQALPDSEGNLPAKKDICDPPVPPDVPDCNPATILNEFTVCLTRGEITFVAPDVAYESNPISILITKIINSGNLSDVSNSAFDNVAGELQANQKFMGKNMFMLTFGFKVA